MIKLRQGFNQSVFYAESTTCGGIQLELTQKVEDGVLAPTVILAIEVLLAVSFNVAAISLYYRKPGRLKNAGNKFTVSLMVVDLLFCGLAIPLTLAAAVFYRGKFGSRLDEACLAFQSLILFSATSSTLGTALIALDRADISIRPSRRFFNESRQARTLFMTWLVSLATLFVPFVASNTTTFANSEDTIKSIDQIRNNISVELNVEGNCTLICNEANCQDNKCSLTGLELAVRVALQTTVFLLTSVTTLTIYLRILWTVQRRNYRYDKNLMQGQGIKSNQSNCRKADMFQKIFCCVPNASQQTPLNSTQHRMSEEKTLITNNHADENIAKNDNPAAPSNFVMVVNTVDANENKSSTTKTDFASVALSITVVLALKRMVAAKIARKRKKVRHLRRMTILILFSFLLGWTPFHVLPIVKIIWQRNKPPSDICFVSDCSFTYEECNTASASSMTVSDGGETTWEILFLWSLVFAAWSSIVNPFVYSFSREKLREEMKQKFECCKSDEKNRFKSRGRSAIWTSPWGRNKGNNSPRKPKDTPSPKQTKQLSISNITL